MTEVQLVSWPFPCYRGALVQGPWKPGEVRQVSEGVAEYLCGTFPGCFARTSGFDASGLLSLSARELVDGLDGLTPDDLRAALESEESGKGRKTVLRAIRAALEG